VAEDQQQSWQLPMPRCHRNLKEPGSSICYLTPEGREPTAAVGEAQKRPSGAPEEQQKRPSAQSRMVHLIAGSTVLTCWGSLLDCRLSPASHRSHASH